MSVQPSKAMERDWNKNSFVLSGWAGDEKLYRARLRSVKENEHNQNENLGHCITLKQIMVKAIMARPAVKWNECMTGYFTEDSFEDYILYIKCSEVWGQ